MADGFRERLHHVALVDGQRLDQHRDAAVFGVRRDRGQAIDVSCRVACSRVRPPVVVRCLGEPNTMHAVRAEVGAEVDQVADVLPASRAQGGVGRGDVQALGADHQPVQADERQPFGGHDVAIFARAGRR